MRDWLGRVFMFREDGDAVVVDEVHSVESATPNEYVAFTQVEPRFQVAGSLVFRGRETDELGIRVMRLERVQLPRTFVAPGEFVSAGAFL